MSNRCPRPDKTPSSGELYEVYSDLERTKQEHQYYRFYILLCFTTLSLAVQFSVKSHNILINIGQILSWILLLMAGFGILFSSTRKITATPIFPKWPLNEQWNWYFFLLGILGQIVIRSFSLFVI